MSASAPGEALLTLEAVHAYYGLAHVLQGVTLDVGAGELVALLGRNGAGKTTTLRSVMGLVDVREGSIRYQETEVVGRATETIAQLGIGYVPEDRRMFPGLSVRQNLTLASLGAGLDRAEQTAAVRRTLEIFPALERHLELDASRLSGGQQQMVAIGRGLICGRRLLLVDEPTQGLAPIIATEIGKTLRQIADDGVGVLLVEQNSQMALALADRAYVLERGAIVATSEGDDIRKDPEYLEQHLKL